MKPSITLFFLCFFLQINAQESATYTEAGTSFFLQFGSANNLYSKLISDGNSNVNFFNDSQASKVDRSVSAGIALELIRANVGFRLQTNRIRINETYELNTSSSDNSFGQFISKSTSITHGEQINYEVVPGIHRYFQINKWIFSAGIETPFTIYDIYKFSQNTNSVFSSSSGDFNFEQSSSDELMGEIPGGYDIGIGTNIGLQYAFSRTLKIAIQYAPSMRHYKIGGETDFVRKFKQESFEQFENEIIAASNSSSVLNTRSTNTQSKTAEFRERMNFAFIFSF